MTTIDFTPLYRNSVGFDTIASLFNSALNSEPNRNSYPPYNIEVVEENRYTITIAVAGFEQDELNINVEKGVLTVHGEKANKGAKQYLHQGIAFRSFERKFNLADHIKVTGADLNNGLLVIGLYKEIPEAMKPKTIAINSGNPTNQGSGESVKSIQGNNNAA